MCSKFSRSHNVLNEILAIRLFGDVLTNTATYQREMLCFRVEAQVQRDEEEGRSPEEHSARSRARDHSSYG